MGRAGQERVLKYFDWERKIDQIIEIYQQTKPTNSNGAKTYAKPTSMTDSAF